ncbi:hypothetical protein [Polaribacter ponticola]|uniref:Uncharacterized protein n=1 Tax=Polaribacter ponticola TaxID=2978475 RepID=A0ABT5S4B6_9FLAO|nr:hypothetical protein [Polaribacter sp. MSW5]MDD7912948.1 hypothetical protein [Polaribacter sp. MSW5]MDD7913754.1 hypothetical protein [Polaribacter sp. MSW5]
MTVKELKAELNKYPENMDVFIAERKTDYTFGLLNSVTKREVTFSEDPDYVTELNAKDDVLILDEE